MCIAIYKPAGIWANKARLRESFTANPDGAGFAYHDGQRVVIKKGFFTWSSFWAAYKNTITAEMPALIHFRIATVGGKTKTNCHPFSLGNGALMHNGPCLNRTRCAGDLQRSDSMQFAQDFIRGLTSTQVERIKPMIEVFAGTEKVVMMFDDGKTVICNEEQGHWDSGCWWSNHSYEPWHHTRCDFDFWREPKKYTRASVNFTLDSREHTSTLVWSSRLNGWTRKHISGQSMGFDEQLTWHEGTHAYVLADCMNDDIVADEAYVYDGGTAGEVIGIVVNNLEELQMLFGEADINEAATGV